MYNNRETDHSKEGTKDGVLTVAATTYAISEFRMVHVSV
jgi:hypothetical protein